MVQLEDILWDNECTSEYLVANCEIAKTTITDFAQIGMILLNVFHIPQFYTSFTQNVMSFFTQTKLDINNCVKLYDKNTGLIYGLLMVGNNKLWEFSSVGQFNPLIKNVLKDCSQINGIGFIIDERLRGKGFDKKMLYFNKAHFNKFDLVWHGVDKSLRTHKYWKRFGFNEIFDDGQVKYYAKFLN